MFGAGLPYFIGLMVAAGISLHHYKLIKDRNRENCFAAFLHNNWLGAVVFAGMVVDYFLR
jgi:4-hydroxybenzoate polyprenyltransferase